MQNGTYEISRDNYAELWKRVVRYGQRVKSLKAPMITMDEFPDSLALAECVKRTVTEWPRSLLPNLQAMNIVKQINGEGEILNDIVQLSLGENTNLVYFKFFGGAEYSGFMKNFRLTGLENLRELCLNLRLDLARTDESGIVQVGNQLLDRLLKIILQPKKLRKLYFCPLLNVDGDIQSYLATQPPEVKYLCSLLAELPNMWSRCYAFSSPMAFLSELELEISFSGSASIRNTFFPQLEELKIYSQIRENQQSLKRLVHHISQEFPNLEAVSLGCHPRDILTHEQDALVSVPSYTDLQPIFGMEQLERFLISWPTTLAGTDDNFKSLFSSRSPRSKRFERLSFHAFTYGHETNITYDVLPFLAEHPSCSSLTDLNFQLDFSSFPTGITTEGTVNTFPNLKYITFGESIVPEDELIITQLAEWVARMIPSSCFIGSDYVDASHAEEHNAAAMFAFISKLRSVLWGPAGYYD